MSRKAKNYTRIYKPDTVHGSVTITKFINKVMIKGKKSTAENITYKALEKLGEAAKLPPLDAFKQALKNVIPLMEVRSRRVGGSTYQVPVEVRPERGVSLAMRWIVGNSRNRGGKSMIDRLSGELIDAFNKTGTSVKKREDTHKMAESNKAFAHFRW